MRVEVAAVRAAVAAVVVAVVKAEVVVEAVAVAVVAAAVIGKHESDPATTTHKAVAAIAPEVGLVTVIGIETVTRIVTKIVIVIVIETETESGIVIEMSRLAFIATLLFTSPEIMAAIAPTLTTVAIRTACSRARTTHVEGRATTRSVHTSTAEALPVSSLPSAMAGLIETLTGRDSCADMKKAITTLIRTSLVAAFILSRLLITERRTLHQIVQSAASVIYEVGASACGTKQRRQRAS